MSENDPTSRDEPPPSESPHSEFPQSEPLRAGLLAGASVGTLFGLFDGLVRTVGIDPGLFLIRVQHEGLLSALTWGLPSLAEVPGLLACTLAAAFLYALGTAAFAGGAIVLARAFPRALNPGRGRRLVLLLTVTGWLFLELYWWTRPVLLPGLSATDPRRLAAATGLLVAALFVSAWISRRVRGPRGRPFLALLVLTWIAGAAAFTVDRLGSGATRGHLNERNRDVPNVLLFVVDALRQDVLGCYGHPTVKTPTVDRLAEEGVLFANAFVQVPFTGPSFGSFLTGKYPRRHGLLKMVPGYTMPPNVTLPLYVHGAPKLDGGELAEEDFVGGAFLTGTLSHGSGLAQGFDYYFEALVGHELVDVHSTWSKFRSGLLPWLYKNKLSQRVDNRLVATTAANWFREFGDRRFIAMVHYYSTHTPYDPPAEYREMYCDPAYDGPISAFYAEHRIAIENGDYVPGVADRRQIRDLYWAGVTQADDMIREVLVALEEKGVLDDTIVVVTSDHGEALGEHGLWEHNFMYQNNLSVPLIVRWPSGSGGALPEGTVVEPLVDSIDLVPTLLELMGLVPLRHVSALPDGASYDEQIEVIDGVSLVPLVRGEVDAVRPYSFAENGTYRSVQDGRYKLILRHAQVEEEGWQAMLDTPPEARVAKREAPRLFDLQTDPGELENLFLGAHEEHAARVDELRLALRAWSDSLPIRVDQVIRSDRDLEADRLRLEELGYGPEGIEIGGGEEDDEDESR